MTQVILRGEKMSAKEAAALVIEEVEEKTGGFAPWKYLPLVLDEWCEPKTRFSVHDAVCQKIRGEKLN